MKDNQVKEEYSRLKSLFVNVDEVKSELVDELLKKAAFLKVELDELEEAIKKSGPIEISSRGNTRVNLSYKTFLQSLNIYQTIIKSLNSIMGKNLVDTDDEFDDFMERLNE